MRMQWNIKKVIRFYHFCLGFTLQDETWFLTWWMLTRWMVPGECLPGTWFQVNAYLVHGSRWMLTRWIVLSQVPFSRWYVKFIEVLAQSSFCTLFSWRKPGSVFLFCIYHLEKLGIHKKIICLNIFLVHESRFRTWKLGFWIWKRNGTRLKFVVSSLRRAPVGFNP